MVYRAAWFLTFLAPHLLLGTSLASKYLIMFEAHFGAPIFYLYYFDPYSEQLDSPEYCQF